ncbi:DUF411 domain-containing protein [Marinobacter caseinilyticus]|uniref:DUF411 domain-containing protein n=1 Tax=Marinobacter caseinilyticus TaxID=2692195 RepID=UPI0014094F69
MTIKALSLAFAMAISPLASAAGDESVITVYKSPSCGCCGDWVKHLEANDFEVAVRETNNLNPIKMEAGLTSALASCHTAFVDGYVIEGHVPANDIRRLIEQAPKAKGLTVPGMPAGSPGMEMGNRQDAYQVLLFNDEGQTRVFADYP